MQGDDAIPVIGLHRGVPLEDQQSDARLAVVGQRSISFSV
jgi:hypothetical protein